MTEESEHEPPTGPLVSARESKFTLRLLRMCAMPERGRSADGSCFGMVCQRDLRPSRCDKAAAVRHGRKLMLTPEGAATVPRHHGQQASRLTPLPRASHAGRSFRVDAAGASNRTANMKKPAKRGRSRALQKCIPASRHRWICSHQSALQARTLSHRYGLTPDVAAVVASHLFAVPEQLEPAAHDGCPHHHLARRDGAPLALAFEAAAEAAEIARTYSETATAFAMIGDRRGLAYALRCASAAL